MAEKRFSIVERPASTTAGKQGGAPLSLGKLDVVDRFDDPVEVARFVEAMPEERKDRINVQEHGSRVTMSYTARGFLSHYKLEKR